MTTTLNPNLELIELNTRDLNVLLDTSGSMQTIMRHPSTNQPITRWTFIKEWVQGIVGEACAADENGIDLYTFGGVPQVGNNINTTTAMTFLAGVSPRGGTPLGQVLNTAINNYTNLRTANDANGVTTKPISFIILFDGTPDNVVDVQNAIINLTRMMTERGWDDSDVGISILQIDGPDTCDQAELANVQAATSWLESLDNELTAKGATLDIVDTKTFSEWSVLSLQQIVTLGIKD